MARGRSTPGRRYRPRTRLLFDELLPWRVPAALRVLSFRASYVGNVEDAQPPRGSSDEQVLDHAIKTGQVIVTSNHDMVLLCAEKGESLIWIDPRGRQFRFGELLVLVFQNARFWEEWLTSDTGQLCIRALRTKNEVLALDRAEHLVRQRMRRIRSRQRRRRRRPVNRPEPQFPDG